LENSFVGQFKPQKISHPDNLFPQSHLPKTPHLYLSHPEPEKSIRMTKNELLRLLAENQLADLFDELKTSIQRDLILLESQWNDLRQRQQLGLVSAEQADLEDARIRYGLLDVIEKNFGEKPAPAPASAPVTAPDLAEEAPKLLPLPITRLSITSTQAGPITWELLQAERSGFNPDNWQLRIEAKCIRPLYGQHVHAGTMHLRRADDEIAPFNCDFPFVEAGTTQTGSFQFEVPRTWKKVVLVIYQQEYDQPKEACVEMELSA